MNTRITSAALAPNSREQLCNHVRLSGGVFFFLFFYELMMLFFGPVCVIFEFDF
jgi:hypothetical protein